MSSSVYTTKLELEHAELDNKTHSRLYLFNTTCIDNFIARVLIFFFFFYFSLAYEITLIELFSALIIFKVKNIDFCFSRVKKGKK